MERLINIGCNTAATPDTTMNNWTKDRPHYQDRHDLAKFEPLNTPIWIFDVDRHAMWWGNASALAFWRADRLDALLALDYSSDSEAVRMRLRQMVKNPKGNGRIQETWTLYPDESPTTVIADIQPVLIEEKRHAIMVEASRKLDLMEDPESLRMLEAARSSALMVSSFTMTGALLSQNPAAHTCYARMADTSARSDLTNRFADETVSKWILSSVEDSGHFEAELAVRTFRGERIHRVIARKGRDPVTGEFITVLNEEDMTEQFAMRRDLQRLNNELEKRVAERTERLRTTNENLLREIEERQAAEEQLRRAQRMEAVGQLTGGIAHDFNNLLAVILGNTEILEDERGWGDEYLAAIRRAALRGAELTQRLLAYSRKQPLRPQPIDTDTLVAKMTSLLRRSLGETVEIRTRKAPDPWAALADPGQLENVILNLALNARDAMPGGGTLTIECANMTITAADISDRDEMTPGDYVLLTVSDTGSGMAPEVKARAFEPFFTTKEVGQGSGLGLSMVYGFAKQSGGHVSVTSEEGRGTTVRLFLPRTKSVAPHPPQNTVSDIPRGRGELVLVVEDDSNVLDFAATMLKRLNYRFVAAEDATAAQNVLANGEPVDLVFSDVVLPGGISGPEFVRDLRTRHPEIKAVFMSGYPMEASSSKGLLKSGEILLNKPFRARQMAIALRRALN